MKKIAVLIPCHNEAKGIARVIKDIPVRTLKHMGYTTEIIVIDNNSTDNTAKIAHAFRATVLDEPKKGKGNAMRAGFAALSADTDFIVMLDGDNTYKASEIPRLIEPLASGFCDVVVGTRLGGKTIEGSLKFQNRLVNWAFAFLVRQFYKANVTDVMSGFFAWRKDVITVLNGHVRAEGFAIEMDMITKIVKLGYQMYSVPITYDVRKGETKISPFKDGVTILYTLGRNIFWKPPKAVKVKTVSA